MRGRAEATRTAPSRRSGVGLAVMVLGGLLSGCAQIGLPIGTAPTSNEITGSISRAGSPPVKAKAANAVDPSDWETVRRTLATALLNGDNKPLDWDNPDTGSSGTITPTVELASGQDSRCRLFATTLSDYHGVRRFRGEICRQSDGRWQLLTVSPDDATLS